MEQGKKHAIPMSLEEKFSAARMILDILSVIKSVDLVDSKDAIVDKEYTVFDHQQLLKAQGIARIAHGQTPPPWLWGRYEN
jgi:hypothetical protein